MKDKTRNRLMKNFGLIGCAAGLLLELYSFSFNPSLDQVDTLKKQLPIQKEEVINSLVLNQKKKYEDLSQQYREMHERYENLRSNENTKRARLNKKLYLYGGLGLVGFSLINFFIGTKREYERIKKQEKI